MKEELFAKLIESIRQGGAILRGEKAPSRTFEVKSADDPSDAAKRPAPR